MAVLLSGLALVACSGDDEPAPPATGPVDVAAAPDSSALADATCRRLLASLPQVVGPDLPRRPVTGDPTRTAAWGDPAVTLRCGTGPSGSAGIDGALFGIGVPGASCVVDPDPRECLSLLQRDTGSANAFTTTDRTVNVEVEVPDAFDSTLLQSVLPQLVGQLPPVPGPSALPAPTPSANPYPG